MFANSWITTRRYSGIICAALAATALARPVDADSVTIGGARNNNTVVGSATLVPGVGGAVNKSTDGGVVDATGLDKKVVPGAREMNIPDTGVEAIPQPPKGDVPTCQQYSGRAAAVVAHAGRPFVGFLSVPVKGGHVFLGRGRAAG